MKKTSSLLFQIIFLLVITDYLRADEDSSLDVVGTGSFGASTINGKIYNQISFRPEIRFNKLGIGLDISIYIDENGEIIRSDILLALFSLHLISAGDYVVAACLS